MTLEWALQAIKFDPMTGHCPGEDGMSVSKVIEWVEENWGRAYELELVRDARRVREEIEARKVRQAMRKALAKMSFET